jgi:hypothetical protein
MVRDIKIGDQSFKAKAMASTDRYYMAIFGADPIVEQAMPGFGAGNLISMMERMCFVMVKQAEIDDPAEMTSLGQSDYLKWLDTVERTDLLKAIPKVRALYEGQKIPSSTQKKMVDKKTDSTT